MRVSAQTAGRAKLVNQADIQGKHSVHMILLVFESSSQLCFLRQLEHSPSCRIPYFLTPNVASALLLPAGTSTPPTTEAGSTSWSSSAFCGLACTIHSTDSLCSCDLGLV
jgi:hypothetical protein